MAYLRFIIISSLTGFVKAGMDMAQCEKQNVVWVSESLCVGPDITTTPTKCTASEILSSPAYECHEFITAEERFNHNVLEDEEIQSYLTNFMVMAALAREYEMETMRIETFDREQMMSVVTSFILLASLTRDIEMMYDESANDNMMCGLQSVMPWNDDICKISTTSFEIACSPLGLWSKEDEIQSMLRMFLLMASLVRNIEMQKEYYLDDPKNAINIKMTPDESSSDSTFKQVHRTEPLLEPYSFESNRVPAFSTKNHKNDNGDDNGAKVRFGLPRDKVREFVRSNTGIVSAHHSWRKIPEKEYV